MYFSKQVFITIATLLFTIENVQAACNSLAPELNGGCAGGFDCGDAGLGDLWCCDTAGCGSTFYSETALNLQNVIELAETENSSVTGLGATLSANGGAAQIQKGITDLRTQTADPASNNLGWGGGVTCDLNCTACADCATAAGETSIAILSSFALAGIACLAIFDCPAALATATISSLASIATFCNSQHQSATCAGDCAWLITNGQCPAAQVA